MGFRSNILLSEQYNVIGLQLADLIAYPITRHVLDPISPNPAYEIVRDKIYTYKGAVLGMKIIPH